MIQAIERYMKQAIVDRNSAVSSAALISSFVSPSYLVLGGKVGIFSSEDSP
jgi:hypothetical protein